MQKPEWVQHIPPSTPLHEVVYWHIYNALVANKSNRTQTALALKISLTMLRARLDEMEAAGIEVPPALLGYFPSTKPRRRL